MKWMNTPFSGLTSYVKRSAFEACRWLRAGETFWKWLVVTLAILLVFYAVHGELPDRVRWAGSTFEFFGISAVVISISRARRSFGKPSVLGGIWICLRDFRFIFFRRAPITGTMNITLQSDSMVSVGTVVNRVTKSTEERVAQLEKQFTGLQTKLVNIDQKVDQNKRELRAELNKEAAERQAADHGVSNKLEESMIGESPLELAGVAYLYLGLAMTHLSPEVANVLKWVGLT